MKVREDDEEAKKKLIREVLKKGERSKGRKRQTRRIRERG